MRKFKLITTMNISNQMPKQFDLTCYELDSGNWIQRLNKLIKLIFIAAKSDALLVGYPDIDILIVCFLAKIFSAGKTKTFVYDIILQKPNNIRNLLIAYCHIFLFWGIDKFICHHKDTSGYERYYKINNNKFHYVPFKANNYNMLSNIEVKDGDYVLACGASCRDYETFVKSIMNLGYSTKIVLPEENVAEFHHTTFNYDSLPSYIEIHRKPWFDKITWNEFLAKSRVVVIPIKKNTIQQAGLSVLLESFALGKPVVITEGEATKGIITSDVAMIVPREDTEKMTKAIKKIWCDDEYRMAISKNAKDFALELGGTERMVNDIFQSICTYLVN